VCVCVCVFVCKQQRGTSLLRVLSPRSVADTRETDKERGSTNLCP